MTRTQILLPDSLYKQAKEFSEYQEISLAELVRRGLEMFMRTTAPAAAHSAPRNVWTPPTIRPMDTIADPFEDEGWREALLHYGVDTFATRNVKDFTDAGFPTLIDPFL